MDQPTLAEMQASVKLWVINDPKAERIHIKIADIMALDCIPANVGFTCLLHTIEPRYKIPSRKDFTDNVLPKIKENIDTKLFELLLWIFWV